MIVDPINGVDGLTAPFATITRAALEGGTVTLKNTSETSPYSSEGSPHAQGSAWLTDASLEGDSGMAYIQRQPLVNNLPHSFVTNCNNSSQYTYSSGASFVSDAGAVGGVYTRMGTGDRVAFKTAIAKGQKFKLTLVGRNSLANGLKITARQDGKDYLNWTTGVFDAGAGAHSVGFPAGNGWTTYESDAFTMDESSGSFSGIHQDVEFRFWSTGAGTADIAFVNVQKIGEWEEYLGGNSDTYRYPIGARTEAQYGVNQLFTSSTGPKKNLADVTESPEGSSTNLSVGEWWYEHNTTSVDGGYIYYRLNTGETINGMWFLPMYGSKSDAVLTAQGSGSISNITTYGGYNRGINVTGASTVFTGSNINAYLAGVCAIGARLGAEFTVDTAECGTALYGVGHSKGFMADRGGVLTLHRGNTLDCHDNAYQVFNDATSPAKRSGLFLTSCRISGRIDIEYGTNGGHGINCESMSSSSAGYEVVIDHCLLAQLASTTASVIMIKRQANAGVCSFTMKDTVLTTNGVPAIVNTNSDSESAVTISGSGNRWGGAGVGKDTIVGSKAADIRATGSFLTDLNDEYMGSNPLSSLKASSVLVGAGAPVAFTDYYGNTFKNPSSIGAYAFLEGIEAYIAAWAAGSVRAGRDFGTIRVDSANELMGNYINWSHEEENESYIEVWDNFTKPAGRDFGTQRIDGEGLIRGNYIYTAFPDDD